MNELESFVNGNDIKKEDIIQIFQAKDGTFTLVYYGE